MKKFNYESQLNLNPNAKDGKKECPNCGSGDVEYNINKMAIVCNHCDYEFKPKRISDLENDIWNIQGRIIGNNSVNITDFSDSLISVECSGCGAHILFDSSKELQKKCHWCGNSLSINTKIPNGAVPDLILPFSISKEEAFKSATKLVSSKSLFTSSKFKKSLTLENLIPVYLPYAVVDLNLKAEFKGIGEHLIVKKIYLSSPYGADIYDVERHFDIVINDLSIETSKDKLLDTNFKTNNIINSILPFDTHNCVPFDAMYLNDSNLEIRDLNLDTINDLLKHQALDIAKAQANSSLSFYDRGVLWNSQSLDLIGEKYLTAYLPVWLYSYKKEIANSKKINYIAVNGRTSETNGSIPFNYFHLITIGIIIFLTTIILAMSRNFDSYFFNYIYIYAIIAVCCTLSSIIKKYKNSNARHLHEKHTYSEIRNLKCVDKFITHKKNLPSKTMEKANNNKIYGNRKKHL